METQSSGITTEATAERDGQVQKLHQLSFCRRRRRHVELRTHARISSNSQKELVKYVCVRLEV